MTEKDIDEVPVGFGKYEGLTFNQIAKDDPSYVIWAHEEFSSKPCSRKLYLACVEVMEERELYDNR